MVIYCSFENCWSKYCVIYLLHELWIMLQLNID